jgi:hypothetical protein
MRKRLYVVVATLLIAVLGLAIWDATRQKEPVYQGRRLSYWVQEFPYRVTKEELESNLPTPGPEAIPFLMRYLEKPEARSRRFYRMAWDKLPGWLHDRLPEPERPFSIRYNAAMVLRKMGPLAKPAFPTLVRILREEKDPTKWVNAAYVLQPLALVEPSVKSAFEDLGSRFRTKDPHHRGEEAQKVRSLLPTCPVNRPLQTPTGTLMAPDYSHPSYKLSKEQVLTILGDPDTSDDESITYRIDDNTNNAASPQYHLSIRFADGYVCESKISWSRKQSK